MSFLLTVSAGLLAAVTLLPLSTSRRWYIRALDFPRLQFLCVSVLWLLVVAYTDAPQGMLITVCTITVWAVLVYQLYWILPNTQLYGVELEGCLAGQGKDWPSISILSYNVLMHNRNSQALLTLVEQHQPDILITLESDLWWQEKLDTLDSYPYRMACPLDNLYGMHIYSRMELVDSSIDYLVEPDKPSMQLRVRLREQEFIKLHVTHPAPPAPQENTESIERDVELLIIAKSVAKCTEPVIVAGDLNDVAWSATTRLFREISGLKDARVGRGLFNTFNARHLFVRWPLDHVFASQHFRLVKLQRLPDIGSDHFPLLAELALAHSSIPKGSETQTPTDPELLKEIEESDTANEALKLQGDP